MSALNSPERDKSDISVVLAEAKGLTYLLGEWRVSQVKRDCNQVANSAASLARRTKHSAAWWGQASACARASLKADCINSAV